MKTRKIMLVGFVICVMGISLSAQEAIEKEVNEQVWKPFSTSWSKGDYETFNNLHTDDVLRAASWGIIEGRDYKDRNTNSFKAGLERGDVKTIQFWFEHRVYSDQTGYEVGYYKINTKRPGQEARTFYARFHIVLKKVNGTWKIAQDWDTNDVNGNPVAEEDWKKGKAIDF